MGIEVRLDYNEVRKMLKAIGKELPRFLIKPLYRAADFIRGVSQEQYLRGPRPDRLAVVSSRLFGSLRAEAKVTGKGAIGIIKANAHSDQGFDYPAYWETDGSAHGGPRPFLKPARDEHKDKWMKVFNKVFEERFNQWQKGKQF